MSHPRCINALLVVLALMSGCSSITAVSEGPQPAAYGDLAKARAHAQSVLNDIDETMRHLDDFNGVTSTGLFAAGSGAGIAGVFDAHTDLVSAFAVAGATLLGATDLVKSPQRQIILRSGKEALFCAMEQTSALDRTRTGSLKSMVVNGPDAQTLAGALQLHSHLSARLDVETLETKTEIQAAMGASIMLGGALERSLSAASAFQELQDAAARLDEKDLADTLTRTTERIRAELEKQLRALNPDPKQIFRNQREVIGKQVKDVLDKAEDSARETRLARTELQSVGKLAYAGVLGFESFRAVDLMNAFSKELAASAAVVEQLERVNACLNTVTPGTPGSPT